MAKKERKDPRQRLGTSQKSVVVLSVRLPRDEYIKIVDKCKEVDLTLSNYIRYCILPEKVDA